MAHERRLIVDVVHALNMELDEQSQLKVYLYEEDDRVLDATEVMQTQLIEPLRQSLMGICLFGERIGTPLSKGFTFPEECPESTLPEQVVYPWSPTSCVASNALPLTGSVFELFYFRALQCVAGSEADRKSLFVLLSGGPEVLNDHHPMHKRKFGQHRWLKEIRAGEEEADEATEAEYRQQRRWVANLVDNFSKTDVAIERIDAISDEAAFRQLIEKRIRQGLGLIRSKVTDTGPGLAPVSNPADLHGRDAELERLRTVLAGDSQLVIVHGLPGVGKSSVLKAGLVPALRSRERWPELGAREVLIIRAQELESPENQPWSLLAAAINDWLASFLGAEKVDPVLSDPLVDTTRGPELLCAHIGNLVRATGCDTKLILVIDQAEQILSKLIGENTESDKANARAICNFLGKFCSQPLGQATVALPNGWQQLISSEGALAEVSALWSSYGVDPVPFIIDQPDDRGRRELISRFFRVRDILIDNRISDELASQAAGLTEQSNSTSVMPALALTLKEIAEHYFRVLLEPSAESVNTQENANAANEKAESVSIESQAERGEYKRTNLLTFESCSSLLDLRNAIGRLADEAWRCYEHGRRAGFHTQRALNQILSMVTEIDIDDFGDSPRPVRSLRSLPRSALASDHIGRELLDLVDVLVDFRILIDQAGVLSLVHECVLDSWKVAADWYADRAWNQLILRQARKLSVLWRNSQYERYLFLPGDKFEFPGCAALLPNDDAKQHSSAEMKFSDLERVWGMEYDAIGADNLLLAFVRACLLAKKPEHQQHHPEESLYWISRCSDLEVLEHYLGLNRNCVNTPRKKDQRVALHSWAYTGDMKCLNALLRCGAAVEVADEDDYTPLMIASFCGHSAGVQTLIENRAKPATKAGNGVHAGYWAARNGNLDTLIALANADKNILALDGPDDESLLIAACAEGREKCSDWLLKQSLVDTWHRSSDGSTALDMAAQLNNLVIVKQLLSSDPALLNAEGFADRSALIAAAVNGHELVARWLLEQPGINVMHCQRDGAHVLDAAAQSGNRAIVEAVLKVQPKLLNAAGFEDRTALIAAAVNGHEEVAMWLLEQLDIDVMHCEKDGMHVLDAAAQSGSLEIVKAVLGVWPDLLNALGFEDRSALIAAAVNGHEEVAMWLLEQLDIDVMHREKDGTHVLDAAAQSGSLEIVKAVLDVQPSLLNAPGFEDRTALISAAMNGHESVVSWLLEQPGISLEQRDNNGLHIFEAAVVSGNLSLVHNIYGRYSGLLNQPGREGHRPLIWACLSEHESIVDWLLEQRDLDLLARSENGTHAFYAAAETGTIPIAGKLLARHPAWLNAPGFEGRSALIGACVFSRENMVDWLIDKPDTDLTIIAENSLTATMVAAAAGCVSIVEKLVCISADLLEQRGANGTTLLIAAATNGHLPMVEWLLQQNSVDLYAQAEQGNRVFEMTASQGHLDVLQWLYEHDNDVLNTKGVVGFTALQVAILMQRREVINWLLSLPAIDLRLRADDGDHVLSLAAESGDWELAKRLVEIDPELLVLPGEEDRLAATTARESGHLELANWLETQEAAYRNQ